MLGVRQVTHPVLAPGKRHDALLRNFLEVFLANRAVQHSAGMRRILEKERHVEDTKFGDEGAKRGIGDECNVDLAVLHALDHLHFAAQRAAGVLLDAVLAVRALGDFRGKGQSASAKLRFLGQEITDFQDLFAADGGSGQSTKRDRCCS